MSKVKLETLFYVALNKVKAASTVRDNLHLHESKLTVVNHTVDLRKIGKLYIYGVGKAALDMAKECENILKDSISGGVVVSNSVGALQFMQHIQSTHPEVSQKSIDAGHTLAKKMQGMKKEDYFIFLLSGGASAMIEKPITGLNVDDFKKITSSLLVSGIDIKALNTVRKSISQIKGGKLARTIKAQGVVLVLSDVIGDNLTIIGSAPMLHKKFPHCLIGNNTIALKEAKKQIQNDVQKTKIVTTSMDLPSKKATKYITKIIQKYDKKYESFCLLFGGETTTKVKKSGGFGGRNQELALRLLLENVVSEKISILCAGSDGIDGRSDANGAFLDAQIYDAVKKHKLDAKTYLKNSDSHTFFKELGYTFTTGITGTNVMDFVMVLKEK